MQEISEINKLITDLQGIPMNYDNNNSYKSKNISIEENTGITTENNINEIFRLNFELNKYNDDFIKNRKYKMLEFNFIFLPSSIFFKNSKFCEKFDLKKAKKNSIKIDFDNKIFTLIILKNKKYHIKYNDKFFEIEEKEISISNVKFYIENNSLFFYNEEYSKINKTFRIKFQKNSEIKFFINIDDLEKSISTPNDITSYYCVSYENNFLKIGIDNNKENFLFNKKESCISSKVTRNSTNRNYLNFEFKEENITVEIRTNMVMEIDGIYTFKNNYDDFSILREYELENWKKCNQCKFKKNDFLILQCKNNKDFTS